MIDALWLGDRASADAQQRAAGSMAAFMAKNLGGRAMSASAQRVLALTENHAYRVQDVVAVLETDPPLAARVLSLVNSAGYGLRARCKSLLHAVTLLGTARLRQVATIAGVLNALPAESEAAHRVREHCIVVGALARHLAASCNLPAEELFTCGVLHDLGMLMLLDAEEEAYLPLLDRSDYRGDVLHDLEWDAFGFDHAILGGYVLHTWKIPSPVPHVVACHHRPWLAPRVGERVAAMVSVLRLADRLADELLDEGPSAELCLELSRHEAALHLRLTAGFFEQELPALDELAQRTRGGLAEEASAEEHAPAPEGTCAVCWEALSAGACPHCHAALCVSHLPAAGERCPRCPEEAPRRRSPILLGGAATATALAMILFAVASELPAALHLWARLGAAALLPLAIGLSAAHARRAAPVPRPTAAPPKAPPAPRLEPRPAPRLRRPPPPMVESLRDPESGKRRLAVRRGAFRGRWVEDLPFADVLHVLEECRREDETGAALLDAHVEALRAKQHASRPKRPSPRPDPNGMSAEEARQVLGIDPRAGPREIKEAHRRLMIKLHPDQGGSTYLAVKINQARDLLLRG